MSDTGLPPTSTLAGACVGGGFKERPVSYNQGKNFATVYHGVMNPVRNRGRRKVVLFEMLVLKNINRIGLGTKLARVLFLTG